MVGTVVAISPAGTIAGTTAETTAGMATVGRAAATTVAETTPPHVVVPQVEEEVVVEDVRPAPQRLTPAAPPTASLADLLALAIGMTKFYFFLVPR